MRGREINNKMHTTKIFESKENATVRSFSTNSYDNNIEQLRIRLTDGRLFALRMNLSEGINPVELADALIMLGNDIKTKYTNG